MLSHIDEDVEIITKLIKKCSDESSKKFALLNQDETRALDEIVYKSEASQSAKMDFWGAVLDYKSSMVAHGKFK